MRELLLDEKSKWRGRVEKRMHMEHICKNLKKNAKKSSNKILTKEPEKYKLL